MCRRGEPFVSRLAYLAILFAAVAVDSLRWMMASPRRLSTGRGGRTAAATARTQHSPACRIGGSRAALFYAIAIVKLGVPLTRNALAGGLGLPSWCSGMAGSGVRASVPLYRHVLRGDRLRWYAADRTPGVAPGACLALDHGRDECRYQSATADGHSAPEERRKITMRIGESQQLAFYDGKNLSDHTITGHALYNVTPDVVGRYFHKTECFCFTSQTLGGRRRRCNSQSPSGSIRPS